MLRPKNKAAIKAPDTVTTLAVGKKIADCKLKCTDKCVAYEFIASTRDCYIFMSAPIKADGVKASLAIN